MIVSIHQPNFFPWLGYFDKINKSDRFMFLVMAQRTSSDNYFTRTSILLNGEKKYLSIPFGKQEPLICELKMPNNKKWIQKHLNLISAAYGKAPYYKDIYPEIEKLYKSSYVNYYEFSINIIKYFLEKLEISTPTYIDIDFNKNFGTSNERNINLCKELNANVYLSGTGAKVYNDIDMFNANSLELIYQNFHPLPYTQIKSKEFIMGLSILDIVFNIGFINTQKLLKGEIV